MRIVGSGDVAADAQSGHLGKVRRITRMPRTPQMPQMPRTPTGFPSPAEDHVEAPLDLHALLIHQPAATYFVQMEGDALQGAGIFDQDILVADRSLYATDGALVVASLNGTLVARFYCPDGEALYLVPANPDYEPITVSSTERYAYEIWGVVVGVVRRLHRHR